MAWEEEGMA
jgi:hypothetical protein